MDEEMDVMDDTTPTAATPLTEQMPMWSSACLAEKLKKLMDTPKQNSDVMDCKSDNPKKQSQSKDLNLTAASPKEISASNANLHEIKQYTMA